MRTRKESLQFMFRMFPDLGGDPKALAEWGAMTKDLSEEELEVAVMELIRTHTYPKPLVGNLMECHRRIVEARIDQSEAAKQWQNSVRKAMTKEGRHWIPKFKNPVTQEIIETFNWSALCNMDEQALTWARKEFIQEYNRISEQHRTIESMSAPARRLSTTNHKQLTGG